MCFKSNKLCNGRWQRAPGPLAFVVLMQNLPCIGTRPVAEGYFLREPLSQDGLCPLQIRPVGLLGLFLHLWHEAASLSRWPKKSWVPDLNDTPYVTVFCKRGRVKHPEENAQGELRSPALELQDQFSWLRRNFMKTFSKFRGLGLFFVWALWMFFPNISHSFCLPSQFHAFSLLVQHFSLFLCFHHFFPFSLASWAFPNCK